MKNLKHQISEYVNKFLEILLGAILLVIVTNIIKINFVILVQF
jgi:hypothetical protein